MQFKILQKMKILLILKILTCKNINAFRYLSVIETCVIAR